MPQPASVASGVLTPANALRPPPGQQLNVVSTPLAPGVVRGSELKQAVDLVDKAQSASYIVAVPVRVQADSRTEAAAGQSAATRLIPSEDAELWHQTVQQLIATEAITSLVRELALTPQHGQRGADCRRRRCRIRVRRWKNTVKDILTESQVAELLDCETSTVQEKLRTGWLPEVKIGRSWIIPRSALLEALHMKAMANMEPPLKAKPLGIVKPISAKVRRPPVLPVY